MSETRETREMLEEWLAAHDWQKVWGAREPDWLIPGIGLRRPGAPGYAGSLIEAIRQQIEREEQR